MPLPLSLTVGIHHLGPEASFNNNFKKWLSSIVSFFFAAPSHILDLLHFLISP